jgi:hypothetical protein
MLGIKMGRPSEVYCSVSAFDVDMLTSSDLSAGCTTLPRDLSSCNCEQEMGYKLTHTGREQGARPVFGQCQITRIPKFNR